MLNEERIYTEVRKYVSDLVDSGEATPVEWIVQGFLQTKGEIEGEAVGLYTYCTRSHLNRIVKKVVGKYEIEARAVQDAQITLRGFEYLQRAYTVTRKDQVVLVPTHYCTDGELLERAEELRKQAIGCTKHAEEIVDFVDGRKAKSDVEQAS